MAKKERRVISPPKFGGLEIKKQEYLLCHNIPFLFDFSQFGEISQPKETLVVFFSVFQCC